MGEEFVFLTSASELECELIYQRLTEAGIKFKSEEKTESFMFDVYGASSPMGMRILVFKSDLEKARELLGIKNQNFSPSKWRVPLILKIIISIVLGLWLLSFIYSAVEIILKPSFHQIQLIKDETAGWQTYRNEEYKFEIRYKPELKNGGINEFQHGWYIGLPDIRSFEYTYCDNCPPPSTILNNFELCQYYIVISIFDNASKLSLEDWFLEYGKNFGYSNQVKEKIVVNGIESIKLGQLGGMPPSGGNIDALVLIPKDSLIYSINLNIDQEVLTSKTQNQCLASGDKIFDQTLSTFKFLE